MGELNLETIIFQHCWFFENIIALEKCFCYKKCIITIQTSRHYDKKQEIIS